MAVGQILKRSYSLLQGFYFVNKLGRHIPLLQNTTNTGKGYHNKYPYFYNNFCSIAHLNWRQSAFHSKKWQKILQFASNSAELMSL